MNATSRSDERQPTVEPNLDPLTPISFLERARRVHADRIAVQDGEVSFTYQQWHDRARRLARFLLEQGVRRGDSVGVLAWNGEVSLLSHYAVPMIGAHLVQLNVRLQPDEIAYIVGHASTRLLLTSPDLAPFGSSEDGCHQVLIDADLDAAVMATDPLEDPVPVVDERSTISINYTSGTTGRPKGVVYHHRGAYLNAVAMALDHGLSSSSTYLWTLPMFHCNGWCFPWATVAVGARNITIPKVDPAVVWQLCADGEVTHLCGAPTVLNMLAESPHARPLDQKVRLVTAGAAPSPTIIGRMEALGFQVDHVYGLTETYGPFTVNVESAHVAPDQRLLQRSRQGDANVTAGVVDVWDLEGRPVPADGATLGEIVMRGNVVMTEYLHDPEATREAFRDGWFHSGDLGVKHPNGQIELRDRLKDLVISGGENISTVEVERTLSSHPAVLECAVVARRDDYWGEVPVAFVSLRADPATTADDLIQHCRDHLAGFKCPRDVIFQELPKSSTGKILKTDLRRIANSTMPSSSRVS